MNETTNSLVADLRKPDSYHYLLPFAAQDTLKKAARDAMQTDGIDRTAIMREAIEKVRRRYPEYFYSDSEAVSSESDCGGRKKEPSDR